MGLLAKAVFIRIIPPPGLLMQGQKKRDSLPAADAVPVQGIVLELPGGRDSEEFSAQVNRMVSVLGAVKTLPSRHCLVLFSNTIDRELLAHRLSKGLKTRVLSAFTADTMQAVPAIIRPYS
ncbi:hypothetical protein FACS189491_10610 [Spirochaetia bacterium]|nr:hypothetical protein FACS189491_10610 [Spirochaetia bacterium]